MDRPPSMHGPLATRRSLLGMALTAPAALLASVAMADPVCVDLDALPASQKSLRKSLGFQLVSDDAKQVCRACNFYTAGEGDCGRCTLLSGPVPAGGRCDSWAKKA